MAQTPGRAAQGGAPGRAAPGRREAHKQATRQALQQAADRLFAEQGYGATTVRDIAEAAGVTERTFFRYFTGKEELIIEDALGWLPVLLDRLRARPADEDVGTALRRAVQDVGALLSASPRPTPVWLFSDGPPGTRISRMPSGTLLRIEADLSAVIRERLEHSAPGPGGEGDREATGTAWPTPTTWPTRWPGSPWP